jgi:chitin disaccharide deacetylase
MKQTRLIVNADDFGMSRGITDAVMQAHRCGALTSASLTANMPAAGYAVACSAKMPALGVGVHLNICQGRPILPPSEIPSLVDRNGNFHSPAALIPNLWRFGVSEDEIEAEFRAQIRWLKDRGINPTHADSHHHMHIYPAAVRPFARALATEGIQCARTPRCSVWPKNGAHRGSFRNSVGDPHKGSFARRVLAQAYRGALQRVVFRELRMPESRIFFRSSGGRSRAALGKRWTAAIANLPAGTFELACHPGIFERGFSETDPIHSQREEELRWLTGEEWLDVVKQSGVCLISYRDLIEMRTMRSSAAVAAAL